jgi:putative nucleotidyltransferase with HDIG domain
VVVLGFSTVRSLALAAGIASVFPACSATFSWPDYWKRSMAAAVYARTLAKCIRLNPETAFTAGLFHDVGLAALAFGAPQQLAEAQAAAGTGDLLAAERALLGFDHALLGGKVARQWNFPLDIELAIRHHHSAANGSGEALVLVTRAAALLSVAADGEEPDVAAYLPQPLLVALGLDPEQMRCCMPQQDEIVTACAALLVP